MQMFAQVIQALAMEAPTAMFLPCCHSPLGASRPTLRTFLTLFKISPFFPQHPHAFSLCLQAAVRKWSCREKFGSFPRESRMSRPFSGGLLVGARRLSRITPHPLSPIPLFAAPRALNAQESRFVLLKANVSARGGA